MDHADKSVFRHSALASGLLTQADIDEAIASVRASRRKQSTDPDRPISDERLGQKLMLMGRLNRWQVEQLRAGRTKFNLGPYQVIDSIGHGGMGQVFKAEHTMMGRVVAVKVLPRSKSTPDAIANFTKEIRAQARLDHENLVRAFDAGHDGNVHFLVTEYVPGTDLRRLIRSQGTLDMATAASIISDAARGLEHAHSRGLIHRDVKPANVLVMPDGRAKLSDLGLAGWFTEADEEDVLEGKVVGTADYLAPEQITNPDKLTTASDIYSLGCTLYYAVTGKVPFPGGTTQDKAYAHCHQPPIDPRRMNSDLTDDFVDVIADMMAKRPQQRIQTAGEVIARLAPWVESTIPSVGSSVSVGRPKPPPVQQPPNRPILVSKLGDTEPYFLVQPAKEPGLDESSSQMSHGTHPAASASQETLSVFRESLSKRFRRSRGRLSSHQWVLMLLGAVAVVAAMTTLLVILLYTAL